MKYFHRAHLPPDAVLARATEFLGRRLTPDDQGWVVQRLSESWGSVEVVRAEPGWPNWLHDCLPRLQWA